MKQAMNSHDAVLTSNILCTNNWHVKHRLLSGAAVLALILMTLVAPQRVLAAYPLTQDLNAAWQDDATNGFGAATSAEVIGLDDPNGLYIDTSSNNIPMVFTASEGLSTFDLSTFQINNFGGTTFLSLNFKGYKAGGGTISTGKSATVTGGAFHTFSTFTGFTGLTGLEVMVTDIASWNVVMASFTIANPSTGSSPPVLTGGSDQLFAENTVNATSQAFMPSVTATDVDSTDFDTGQLLVTYTATGLSEDQLSVGNIGNITLSGSNINHSGTLIGILSGGSNGSNLAISLNSNATPARTTDLLRAIVYGNSSHEPTSYRTASVTLSDGDGATSLTLTVEIAVEGEHEGTPEAPPLTQDLSFPDWSDHLNNGFSVSITGPGTPAGDASFMWISGGTSGASAMVFTAAEQLTGGMFDLTGLSFDIDNSETFTVDITGVLVAGGTVSSSITGSSNAALNAISLSEMVGITSFSMTVTSSVDISYLGLDAFTIANVSSANAPPTIAINNANLSYTENASATQIDSSATLTDSDGDADWNGGTLIAQVTANNETADEISISDSDGDGTAITVSGTNILANGTDIGDLSASGGVVTNGAALTITFDGDATNANVQEVLQSIRYRNTSITPGTSNRTVTFTATDKNNASASDTRTIAMTSVAPTISDVTIPNIPMNVSDAVTVSITAGEAGLSLISGSINGVAVTGFSDDGGGSYSATYTIVNGGDDRTAGDTIPVSFVLQDGTGINSNTYTAAISQSSDSIDANNPIISGVSIPNSAMKVGDAVNVSIIAGEAGLGLISGSVNGVTVTGFTDNGGGSYSATYTVAEGNTDRAAGDSIPVSFVLQDSTGNNSNTYTTAISQAADSIDANSPTISDVIIPNNAMKVGDAVTVTITAGEAGLSLNSGSINGVAVTGFSDDGGSSYSATYTVINGGADRAADDSIPLSLVLQDAAGNNSATYTIAISQSSDSIDANNPIISGVSIPNSAMKVGDAVPVSITAGEAGLSLISGSVNGVTVTGFTDNTGGSYSATYTVAEGNTDRAAGDSIPVSFVLRDTAGNNSATYTTAISQGSDSIDTNIGPNNTTLPSISGTATAGYTLTCSTGTWNDADGNNMTYSYQWRADGVDIPGATSATLQLSANEANKIVACAVTADDGQGSLNSKTTVITTGVAVAPDSDGDGVKDSDDTFPNDPTETVDTDNDGTGNNADPDDDDDGVLDIDDAFPLDINESADSDGDGVGDNSDICPGYDDNLDNDSDLIPDGCDAFPLHDNALILDGMSFAPDDPFLPGIKRSDNGDSSTNLDTGSGDPRVDLGYEFRFVYKGATPPASVKLILNGYTHEMEIAAGNITDGALYSLSLNLGPMPGHSFHFEIGDGGGTVLDRLPAASDPELTGPTIALLHGPSMVGLAKDMTASGQGLLDFLNNSTAKSWVSTGISTDTNNGFFNVLANDYAFALGEGYFVERDTNPTLLDLTTEPDTSTPTVTLTLQSGWNMISNPYGGHILLSSLQVQRGNESPVSWEQACTNNWQTNSIYHYAGDDWGGVYNYESAGGNPDAILTPWFSYWVYLIRDDSTYKLIFTQPQQ